MVHGVKVRLLSFEGWVVSSSKYREDQEWPYPYNCNYHPRAEALAMNRPMREEQQYEANTGDSRHAPLMADCMERQTARVQSSCHSFTQEMADSSHNPLSLEYHR